MSEHEPHSASHDVAHDSRVNRIVEEALMEDLGMGDVTTEATVSGNLIGAADLIAKESGVVAGLDIVGVVFSAIDSSIQTAALVQEGSRVYSPALLARIEGPVASILKAERTSLNILQRMSGIATLTRKFVDAIAGMPVKVTDTRKTVPGLRLLDKLAVERGGGVNHRFGLDDMVLIKDNHIAAAGGITNAVNRCLALLSERKRRLRIEVETKTLDEVDEVLHVGGIHRIMLDNFSLDDMKKAVRRIHHSVEVEASGNVSLATVRAIAETGVDFISVGALTHSSKALDISLEIKV